MLCEYQSVFSFSSRFNTSSTNQTKSEENIISINCGISIEYIISILTREWSRKKKS